MPRFVILRHEMPPGDPRPTHFDVMFETGDSLRTWACEQLPDPRTLTIMADRLADHRLAYLDYEGPVSGNRGSVARIDAGQYESIAETTERIEVRLAGELLRGTLVLRRESPDTQRWSVVFASGSRSV
jgi:hypothetical protein